MPFRIRLQLNGIKTSIGAVKLWKRQFTIVYKFRILEKIKTLRKHINYKHNFGSILEQRDIARAYIEIINIREAILEEKDPDQDGQGDKEDYVKDNSNNLPWAIDNNRPSANCYIRK